MTKLLTVDRYTFYKSKANPLSDIAIGNLYGLDHNGMHKFKKENDLIGKKFEPAADPNKVKVVQEGKKPDPIAEESPETKKTESVKLLKESQIPTGGLIVGRLPEESVQKYSQPSSAMKVEPVTLNRKDELREDVKKANSTHKQPRENVHRPFETEYEQAKQDLLKRIESIEEENDQLKKDIHKEMLRGDQWRDEKLALQRDSDLVIGELKKEIRRLNAALEVHAEDEALLFGLSRKLSSVGSRL